MVTHEEYIKLQNKYFDTKNEEEKRKILKQIQEYNIELIAQYPFLMPKYETNFDFSYSWLDDVLDGWRIAFADDMLKELKEELIRLNYLNDYEIAQIKEKYGELRWYDYGTPVDETTGINTIQEIIDKYTILSRKICIDCGKPARWVSKGWISPYCDECAHKYFSRNEDSEKDIYFYFKEVKDD